MRSGLEESKTSRPLNPLSWAMVWATSRALRSIKHAHVLRCDSIGWIALEQTAGSSSIIGTRAAAISSACRNSLQGLPLPQTITSGSFLDTAA